MRRAARAVRRIYGRLASMLRGGVFFTPTSALLRRLLIYGAFLFLTAVIQTSLPFIPLFRGALPNLTLAAVAAIGFFDSERAGAVAGIAAGAALDALGSVTLSIMPIACFAVGYFAGVVAGRLIPRAPLPYLLCLAGGASVNMFVSIVCAYAAVPELRPMLFFFKALLPELAFTFVFGIPLSFIAHLLVRLAGKSDRGRYEG